VELYLKKNRNKILKG